jgi:predicted metal-binding protein
MDNADWSPFFYGGTDAETGERWDYIEYVKTVRVVPCAECRGRRTLQAVREEDGIITTRWVECSCALRPIVPDS